MTLPAKYRHIILTEPDAGSIYRRCLEELTCSGERVDYAFTEAVVYATEIRLALEVLTGAREESENFADASGTSDARLWSLLDPLEEPSRIAFVGGGPFPVTAFRIRERRPRSVVACIDNNVVAHFVAQAVIGKLALDRLECVFNDAAAVDYQDFDCVVVAAMVSGKRALVERVLETSAARVVVRGRTGLQHERLSEIDASFGDDGSFLVSPG